MTRSARPWLAPLVPLYRLATAARALSLRTGFKPVRRLGWPVVSIGSLSAGGAGKTPLVIALARALAQGSPSAGASRGPCCMNVDVLSRGYGRLRAVPARVDANGTADDFGDEPLLIAQATGLAVYVAAQRYNAGLLAEREAESGAVRDSASAPDREEPQAPADSDFIGVPDGRSLPQGVVVSRAAGDPKWARREAQRREPLAVHLLDDGFQHRELHRDVDIVLLSRHDCEDRLLPSGNLREPLSALRRASILAVPAEEAGLANELHWEGPVWRLHRRMEVPLVASPVAAFCGIARPEQFFSGLTAAGVSLAARIAFPDHHRYTLADVARLRNAAQSAGAAAFLTTEKDRVRLGPFARQLAETIPLDAARLHIEIEEESAALEMLLGLLPVAGGKSGP